MYTYLYYIFQETYKKVRNEDKLKDIYVYKHRIINICIYKVTEY
jgi:hypothetical protein